MRFEPKSEDEVAFVVPPGEYDFEVDKAEHQVSKKGADMIKLTLKVWGPGGKPFTIFDYLLESVAAKLRHFCAATGLLGLYESGTLEPHHCEGKSGTVRLKKKTDDYGTKNEVSDYVVSKLTPPPTREPLGTGKRHSAPSSANGPVDDDSVPF